MLPNASAWPDRGFAISRASPRASDPLVWRDILLANRAEVGRQTAHFRAALDAIEHAMASGDGSALKGLIETASSARAAWQMSSDGRPAAR